MFDFNGLDAISGRPLLQLTRRELEALGQGLSFAPDYLAELREWHLQVQNQPFEVVHGIDLRRLEQAGWGVVWPHGVDPTIKEALNPLLSVRRDQAGDRFRELTLRPNEATLDFLARHGVGPGIVDPRKLPYYLLLVGTPGQIPFSVQYRLDVQYGVGRLDLDDVQAYDRYARTVADAEGGRVRRPRRVSLFGVANPGDRATQRSHRDLVEPLRELFKERPDWELKALLAEAATRARLESLLHQGQAPALLFAAGHGIGYPAGHPEQRARQGALVCQDWPGPDRWRGPIAAAHCLSADNVADDADIAGLIVFLFACFGAGTPRREDFFRDSATRRTLADMDFVARLPQRLLGHPRGGALAVIGHVERAWTYSFDWPRAGSQTQVFESALGRLLDRYPVGAAMDHFGQRYAELAIDVQHGKDDLEYAENPDLLGHAALTLAFRDARSYVVLGDPACRLVASTGLGEGSAP